MSNYAIRHLVRLDRLCTRRYSRFPKTADVFPTGCCEAAGRRKGTGRGPSLGRCISAVPGPIKLKLTGTTAHVLDYRYIDFGGRSLNSKGTAEQTAKNLERAETPPILKIEGSN